MNSGSLLLNAITAGATARLHSDVDASIADGYEAVKSLITDRYPGVDLRKIEAAPDSQIQRDRIAESLRDVGAIDDAELVHWAAELLALIRDDAPELLSDGILYPDDIDADRGIELSNATAPDQTVEDSVNAEPAVDDADQEETISVGDVSGIGIAIGTGAQANVTIQRLDPADARNQRNHKAMRQLVRSFWIDGVLKHSLFNEVLIRLELQDRSDAVDNRPWDLILQQPGQSDAPIAPAISIVEVFDQMNQQLLILGSPGSGKTNILLELTEALLDRAENDPLHPTPVVFNLSSWAGNQLPLVEWLVGEVAIRNYVQTTPTRWRGDSFHTGL